MTETALAAPASPYKGLSAFADSELDALLFFGREREIEVIAANLIAAQLTVLYGPSGVGKTSLLRAGVARRLRSEGVVVAVIANWSGDPIAGVLSTVEREVRRVAPDISSPPPGSLAELLAGWARRLGVDLYLVLDQFEEYFLYHGAEGSAGPLAALADVIRDPGTRVHVLLSVREDALAQLDAFKTQLPGLFGNSLRLDRLDRRAATRAIRGPLERYNELVAAEQAMEAEDELVEEILDSVEAGRIQLGDVGRGGADDSPAEHGRIEAPYLQLVLERLWDVETERGSTRLRLETLRELGGASRIVEDHLEHAMAALSPGEKDAAAAMYNHLVTPSGTKIAHRAGDLARYAAVDEREAQRVLERLARERIVRAGENGSAGTQYEIYHDVLADAVLAWRARHEAERRLADERADSARRQRRLMWIAAASLVAVAVLAGITIYALTQRSSAQENARNARAGELVALAAAALTTDPERSIELALQASDIVRSPAVEDVLRKALRGLRAEAVITPAGPPGEIVLSPRTPAIAVVRASGVQLYGARGLRPGRTLRHPTASGAAFSDDGGRVATFGRDNLVRVWAAASGRELITIVHPGPIESAAFSRDGRELLTAGRDRFVYVWEVRDAFLRLKFSHPDRILAARFSPGGRQIATGASDHLARLWDARRKRIVFEGIVPRGDLRLRLEGHLGPVGDVAFSRNGTLTATGSTDGAARVWETATGERVATLPGHENFVSRVEFSPNGELVATGSRDRKARIFDAVSSTLRATLIGHREAVTDLAFSPDGSTLTTASTDGTVRVWDALLLPRLTRVSRLPAPAESIDFSPDGRVLGSTTPRDDPRLEAGLVEAIDRAGERTAVALSDDGRLAVAGYADGSARVWDAEAAEPLRDLPPHHAAVTSATFSPDGRFVVTTSTDHDARLSEVETGKQEWVLAHNSAVNDADFSADGRWVVIGGGYAGVVDARTGERMLLLDGQDRTLTAAAFSPTGWRVATGGESGAVRTYDCRLCGGVDELVAHARTRLAELSKTP